MPRHTRLYTAIPWAHFLGAMNATQSLLAFTAAAIVLAVTPGVDTAMVLRSATVGGPRQAGFAAAGILLGCLVWGATVSLGLGALLAASPLAFAIVKYAGAAYLLWLGAKLVLRPRHAWAGEEVGAPRSDSREAMKRGFLTNMLNPKIGIFYITFLPQFVPAGADVAAFSFLLAAIHVVIGGLWLALLIAATVPMSGLLKRPGVVKAMDRTIGGIFILFGLKLAMARLP